MPQGNNQNFTNLSLTDLVDARDMFHVHLMNKKNVVATALGRYLIRVGDVDKNGNFRPKEFKPPKNKPPRTLENSVVIDISWPCILVFVTEWADKSALIHDDQTDILPKAVYMPDGRVVPICVVVASRSLESDTLIDLDRLRFPINLIGGGFPLLIESQGVTRAATVGCVVTDGHKYYALTNKHVTGEVGEKVYSVLGGQKLQIGRSSRKSLGKLAFSKLYGGWSGENLLISCDTGLVEIDDIRFWKTDVLDVGQMDEMYDLNTMNMSLDLISEHKVLNGEVQPSVRGNVVGNGAYSRKLKGEIKAFFYRYKSVGGIEYISDFLISGCDGDNLNVHHGDSGLVWHVITKENSQPEKVRPIALHWGQHEFFDKDQKNKFNYSLSTSLSNVCRELDVDLVRGWNIDSDYSWGKTGHYKIAALACDIVSNPKLKKLLKANKENISFTDTGMLNGDMKNAKWGQFCPLADVPDIVWRMNRKDDEANHFADMDESDPNVMGGKTLLDLCKSDQNIDVDVWNNYYQQFEGVDDTKSPNKRGALPFRVWQAFNEMVKYLQNGQVAEFIFVGGTVSHYLGDACQPLHISYLHHGHPGNNAESKVHSVYETDMLDRKQNMQELFDALTTKFKTKPTFNNKYATGKDAAKAVIRLMRKVSTQILSPEEIIDVFDETDGNGRIANMWDKLGVRTIRSIAEGTINVALFWESAWQAGSGDQLANSQLVKIDEDDLMALYMDRTKFPSYKLKDPKYKQAL
jgi:hypothetical protein